MKKFLTICMMLMLTMGILTGCGSGPQTATEKKETEKKIVL